VWNALRTIPFGETRTYRDIAAQVGRPKGMQAIGQANRHNRIPIIIPCHRVVAAVGIGGYAGEAAGGETTATKRWLLRHEGVAGF
jgi:methylated-DNA-[protein]-cysteine S-methyltransferase